MSKFLEALGILKVSIAVKAETKSRHKMRKKIARSLVKDGVYSLEKKSESMAGADTFRSRSFT